MPGAGRGGRDHELLGGVGSMLGDACIHETPASLAVGNDLGTRPGQDLAEDRRRVDHPVHVVIGGAEVWAERQVRVEHASEEVIGVEAAPGHQPGYRVQPSGTAAQVPEVERLDVRVTLERPAGADEVVQDLDQVLARRAVLPGFVCAVVRVIIGVMMNV
jgi:hypothetical protein